MKSWEWLYKEHVLPHIICHDCSRDQDASFCGGPWRLRLSAAARWPPCLSGLLTWCSHPPAPTLQPCSPAARWARRTHAPRKAISPLSAVSHRKKTNSSLFGYPESDISLSQTFPDSHPPSGGLGSNIVIKLEMLQDAFLKGMFQKKIIKCNKHSHCMKKKYIYDLYVQDNDFLWSKRTPL